MFGYMFRAIAATGAVVYTVIAIGLSYFFIPEQSELKSPEISTESPSAFSSSLYILQKGMNTSFQLQQAIDLYSNTTAKKVSISVQTISDGDYPLALRARLLSGEPVDLFQISGAREYLALDTYMMDLSALEWLSSAHPGTLDAVSHNGGIFGVPYSIEGFGLICNRDIFEAAGISLYDVQSADELSEVFSLLNDKISSGELPEDFAGLESVCDFPAGDKYFLSEGFADIAMSGAFASPADAAVSAALSFPAAEPVENIVKLLANYSANPGGWKKLAEISDSRQVERFANGQIAVILHDTSVYKKVNEINPELYGRTFLLPIPLDTFEQPYIYTGVPKYWAISSLSGPETAETAEDFLTWLYCSEEGAGFFASEFGEVSPFRDTAKSTGAALHSQMLEYLSAGMNMPQFHREFPENWGRDIFAPSVQGYFTQRDKTWADVVAESEAGWAELFEQLSPKD